MTDIVNIKIVKLLSGEEFICNILDVASDTLTVDKPMMLVLSPGQNGNPNVHMVPLLPLGEKPTLEIPSTSVLYNYEPAKQLEEKYRETFISKVIRPNRGLILPE